MKASIDVNDRKEAALIKAALDDATVKAFVLVMGALAQLPSDRARESVLSFVKVSLEDKNAEK